MHSEPVEDPAELHCQPGPKRWMQGVNSRWRFRRSSASQNPLPALQYGCLRVAGFENENREAVHLNRATADFKVVRGKWSHRNSSSYRGALWCRRFKDRLFRFVVE